MQLELSFRIQRGTALVFSLLILLIMTVIGVAIMSNTQMQEQMAGNASLQSRAFEAASAGVSDSLMFGMNEFFGDPSAGEAYERRCRSDNYSDWTVVESGDNTLELMEESVQNLVIDYRLRAECLPDPGFDGTTGNPPAEGYITSRGRVRAGGVDVATREVEVRVDDFRTDGRSALRIEGGDESEVSVTFSAPNSNKLFVDGQNGPAVSTTTEKNAEEVQSSIKEQRLANYDGGIASSPYDIPFSSPRELARFALEIKAFMEYHGIDETPSIATTEPKTITVDETSKTVSAQCDAAELDEVYSEFEPEPSVGSLLLTYHSGDATNKKDFDGITYVAGNLSMGGNPTGEGLVIVEGDVAWNGTAEFKGLVIGLNGVFEFDGGGTGNTEGSIFITKLDLEHPSLATAYGGLDLDPATSEWVDVQSEIYSWDTVYDGLDFGNSDVSLDGGGGHRITYDCGLVDRQRMILGACGKTSGENNFPDPNDSTEFGTNGAIYDGLADPWWSQLCNRPGEGGSIQAIRSWRENLGWRELVTGGA